ncbi:hypothetical protein LOC100636050 [Anopheles sinensis]|uniref:Uncharacterized protein n=1 Tax=Anopheles sinensis TaxID=74873 RepID=A0A084VRB1_ANOSI|nr:hypothetical protein LOC100636050 [Anopheles sinensis]
MSPEALASGVEVGTREIPGWYISPIWLYVSRAHTNVSGSPRLLQMHFGSKILHRLRLAGVGKTLAVCDSGARSSELTVPVLISRTGGDNYDPPEEDGGRGYESESKERLEAVEKTPLGI